MFLKCHTRKKDGKEHRYWSILEKRRVAQGKTLDRQMLYGAFDPRSKPTAPTTDAMAPPMSSHMVLSVGFPVKKREKPEAVELEALTP